MSTNDDQVMQTVTKATVDIDTTCLESCSHEETDYKMMMHAAHALNNGCKDVCIVASDTDVVVLTIALASLYSEFCIWIAFGHAKTFRYIPVHKIASKLGKDAAWGYYSYMR